MSNNENSSRRKLQWLKGLTILIAEDDPTNFRLLAEMLKSSGAKIHWAQDGQKAVDFIRNRSPEEKYLVLMDIKMPMMDGFEANRQIKQIDENIPVIAVTAYAQVADRERILKSNFNGYIAKPFNQDILVKELSPYAL